MRLKRENDFKNYAITSDIKKFNLKAESKIILVSTNFIMEQLACLTMSFLFALPFFLSIEKTQERASTPIQILAFILFIFLLEIFCFTSNFLIWLFVRKKWHKQNLELKEKYASEKEERK